MGLKGGHSATKKGNNGKVDPRAKGRTTAKLDGAGKMGKSPAGGNNSRIARSSTAGK
jgi:hypothetical protein